MEKALRIHQEAIRETIRQLRAWSAQWEETRAQAQRAAQALVDAAQAAPARAFEAATAQTLNQLQRSGERIRVLADTMEQALHRLEEAFLQAAHELRGEWMALSLPTTPLTVTTPLAVDAFGKPLPNQFVIKFPTSNGEGIPWKTACGPVALAMALSRLLGHPIPAQEVANRLVEITGKQPTVDGKGRVNTLTSWSDLISTAKAYNIYGKIVSLSSEEAWQELQGLMRQGGAVIALVTAKSNTSYTSQTTPDWKSYVVSEEDRRKGDGGILTGSSRPREGETSHWVVIDRLEEWKEPQGEQRYVVINNPFYNRQERYPWEHFWNSINYQARVENKDRVENKWLVLMLKTQPEIPDRNAVTHP